MATPPNLIHAYRHLLRAGLQAVQFAQPSRSILTQQLRAGFRDPHGTFDAQRVRHTVWFLNAAAQRRGLEHKILKNLCRVHWERANERMPWRLKVRRMEMEEGKKGWKVEKGGEGDPIKQYDHYERTVAMLNDTMGLCLR